MTALFVVHYSVEEFSVSMDTLSSGLLVSSHRTPSQRGRSELEVILTHHIDMSSADVRVYNGIKSHNNTSTTYMFMRFIHVTIGVIAHMR